MSVRVLVTRPQKQSAEFASALSSAGFTPVFLPAIEIRPVDDTSPLDRALSNLDRYAWLVLTSSNAVDAVLSRLEALGIQLPALVQVAAIGPKTAAGLEKAGIRPAFVPDEYIAEAIAPGLGDLQDRWVLLPTADIAPDTLPNAVMTAGGIAHVITAYHTVPAHPDPESLNALRDGVAAITFTSGSTVRNLYAIVENAGLDPLHLPGNPLIACIGPKTAAAARDQGFRVDLVAEEYTTAGLVKALRNSLAVIDLQSELDR